MGIKIVFDGVSEANVILKRIVRELSDIEAEMERIAARSDPRILAKYDIGNEMRVARDSASYEKECAEKILKVTAFGVQSYQTAETQIRSMLPYDAHITSGEEYAYEAER